MPISLRLFIFKPAFEAFRLIRFEVRGPLYGPRVADAQQSLLVHELSKRLPPRIARDVIRDE